MSFGPGDDRAEEAERLSAHVLGLVDDHRLIRQADFLALDQLTGIADHVDVLALPVLVELRAVLAEDGPDGLASGPADPRAAPQPGRLCSTDTEGRDARLDDGVPFPAEEPRERSPAGPD